MDRYQRPAVHQAHRDHGDAALRGAPAGERIFAKLIGSVPGWKPWPDCAAPNCVNPLHYALRPRLHIARRRNSETGADAEERLIVEDALILCAYSPLTVRDLQTGFGLSELLLQTLKRERHSINSVVDLYWRYNDHHRVVPTGYHGPWYGALGAVPISPDLARQLITFKLEDGWITEARSHPPAWVQLLAHSFEVPALAVWRLWVELKADHTQLSYFENAYLSLNGYPVRLDLGRQHYEADVVRTRGGAHVRYAVRY